MQILQNLIDKTANNKHFYSAIFFSLGEDHDKVAFDKLLCEHPEIQVHDELKSQLFELFKIRNPQRRLSLEENEALYGKHLNNIPHLNYGLWVYYPWNNRMVHIVGEQEFIELRTSRNIYKITVEERNTLQSKKIGIVGLSVGQSIALTIAMERICGELRLADFDSLELTNMNRIRTGLHNIGIPKVVLAAREIAEIDPFIKVKCFTDGLHDENIDAFFSDGGNIDILVEECDGIDIKVLSRLKARSLGIPVIMDTNDRGMLDIERFDREPGRALFHGSIPGYESTEAVKGMSQQEKLALLDKMVGFENLSQRMKDSLAEMGKTITTWPQLASSVVLGGAMVTDTCRRILLNQTSESGRYRIDFEEIIK